METKTLAGPHADHPFHLHAVCEPGHDWAVVNASGSLVRGSSTIVSATRITTGQYQVVLNRSATGYAYVATPGLPGAGVVTSPALVFTARGHTDPTWAVYVETKNVGGGLSDFPFQLQVSGNC